MTFKVPDLLYWGKSVAAAGVLCFMISCGDAVKEFVRSPSPPGNPIPPATVWGDPIPSLADEIEAVPEPDGQVGVSFEFAAVPSGKQVGELRSGSGVLKELAAASADILGNDEADETPLRREPPVVELEGVKYAEIGFDRLASYPYVLPDEFFKPRSEDGATQDGKGTSKKDQIPAAIRALNQRDVALEGFMLPLKVESGKVTEFLLMRDQSMCCYGTIPKINEWVTVQMTGAGVAPSMDVPVTIYGKLRVGELYEDGFLVGLYEMAGHRMSVPDGDYRLPRPTFDRLR